MVLQSSGVSRLDDAGTPGPRERAERRAACDDRHVRCSVTWRSVPLAAAALFLRPAGSVRVRRGSAEIASREG